MAVRISFDKSKAEYLIDCLNNGTAIEGIKTTQDMLALIGACRFIVARRAPTIHPGTRLRKLSRQRRQLARESFANDIEAAIDWYTEATRMVVEGEYDARFEPRHYAVAEVVRGGQHRWKVAVTHGSKSYRQEPPARSEARLEGYPTTARAG